MRLRPMRWWDVKRVSALERRLFAATAWSPETFWAELAAPDRWYVVLTDSETDTDETDTDTDETIHGYAGLMANGREADVQTIAVDPAVQGRGLGARLLEALIVEAARRDATSLLLEVAADNDPAIRLYRSRGFERIAVRKAYYQPTGTDAHIMRLRPLRRTDPCLP